MHLARRVGRDSVSATLRDFSLAVRGGIARGLIVLLLVGATLGRAQAQAGAPKFAAAPVLTPSPDSATPRANDSAPRAHRGVFLAASAMVSKPVLGSRAADLWRAVGDFGFGPGMGMALGYDGARFGVVAEVDRTSNGIGGRSGRAFNVALLARIRPSWKGVAGWSPVLAAGLVRELLGATDGVYADQVPRDQLTGGDPSIPDNGTPARMDVIGPGVRLAVGGIHALSASLGVSVTLRADVLRFRQLFYGGSTYDATTPGWSISPGLALSLAWYPGARR